MSDQTTHQQRLSSWFENEKAQHGLLEMAFTPGSDREVSREEAAQVALSMLSYVPDDWFAALPKELSDSVSTLDLRALPIGAGRSEDGLESFLSGNLSHGIFAA